MKDNYLDNKATKLNEEFQKGMTEMTKFVEQGLKSSKKLEADLFAKMTPEEVEKHKAFEKKYNHHFFKGEISKANQVKEDYINEQL